ncbi:hypothetical protein GCM10009872_20120 [Actinopolymorpha rutila]
MPGVVKIRLTFSPFAERPLAPPRVLGPLTVSVMLVLLVLLIVCADQPRGPGGTLPLVHPGRSWTFLCSFRRRGGLTAGWVRAGVSGAASVRPSCPAVVFGAVQVFGSV